MPVGTAQFGQANLSKTETHTEAPMAQLGRAATPMKIALRIFEFKFPSNDPTTTAVAFGPTGRRALTLDREMHICTKMLA